MDGNESDEVARRLQEAGQEISYSPEDLAARLEQVKARAGQSAERSDPSHWQSSSHRLLLAVDVQGYSGAATETQRQNQMTLTRLLDEAADDAGLDPERWQTQEHSDGILAVLPGGASGPRLVDSFMRYLNASLRAFNYNRAEHARLRLRAAVHLGDVVQGANGFTGSALAETARLLHYQSLRTTLAEAPNACLAVAVSAKVFDVVRASYVSFRASEFRPVLVEEKEYRGQAWIWVPDFGVVGGASVHKEQPRTVGAAVRQRRRSLEFTLEVVAERTGLSVPFLSQIESDRARLSRSSLEKVAEALRTTAVELLASAEDHSLVGGDDEQATQRPRESSTSRSHVPTGPGSSTVTRPAGGSYSRQDPVRGESGEARAPRSHGGPRGSVLRSVEGIQQVVGIETERVAVETVRHYSVAPGVRLNVRSGPGTQYGIIRVLPEGAKVSIFCQTPGTTVAGPYGTSNIWDNIDDGQYVSDAYVLTGSDGYIRPRCS